MADAASRLAAAKPIRWRGKGALPSLPWTPAIRGPILLIDLWSGFSGAALALLTMGVKTYELAAEEAPEPRELAEHGTDKIVHIDRDEQINEAN